MVEDLDGKSWIQQKKSFKSVLLKGSFSPEGQFLKNYFILYLHILKWLLVESKDGKILSTDC